MRAGIGPETRIGPRTRIGPGDPDVAPHPETTVAEMRVAGWWLRDATAAFQPDRDRL